MKEEELLTLIKTHWPHGSAFTTNLVLDISRGSQRTIRRQLANLFGKGELSRTGQGKSTQYSLPSKKVHWQDSNNAFPVFSQASLLCIEEIHQPIYTRKPVAYNFDWVAEYIPNQSFFLSEDNRKKLASIGKRASIDHKASTYIQKIFNRLLVDVSYNSSRLEGNTYSLADTEALVLDGTAVEGKMDSERTMILNHKEAINYITGLASNSASPTTEIIRTIHYLLSDGLVDANMSGHVRPEAVGITATTYQPLEGKDRIEGQLENIVDIAAQINDPFEQSLFLLAHIAYLQPFIDVNKRTSRLSCNLPLLSNSYVPMAFVDVQKSDYTDAIICFYELNNPSPLVDLFMWGYIRSCNHYDTQVISIGFDEIKAKHRPLRRQLLCEIISSNLFGKELIDHINSFTQKEIGAIEQDKFREDLSAEIEALDATRIVGLGITRQELETWQSLNTKAD